jgi:hypothetical protein
MNIPAGTILARAKREGWSRQLAAARSKADEPSVVEGIAGALAEQGQHFRRNMGRAHLRASNHIATLPEGEIIDRADKVSTLTKSGMMVFGLDKTDTGNNVVVNLAILNRTVECVAVPGEGRSGEPLRAVADDA